MVDFQTRTETIQRLRRQPCHPDGAFKPAHGPVILRFYGPAHGSESLQGSDLLSLQGPLLAWRCRRSMCRIERTALTPSTPFEAVWGFDKAQNGPFSAARASHFHRSRRQNLVYATWMKHWLPDAGMSYRRHGDGPPSRPRLDGRIRMDRVSSLRSASLHVQPPEGYIVPPTIEVVVLITNT